MLRSAFFALVLLVFSILTSAEHALQPPDTPELSWLYTSFVECKKPLYTGDTPAGVRLVIPITGGNVTGPRFDGQILDLGADWGAKDPQTNIFHADTRYNMRMSNGADVYVRTRGPMQPAQEGMHVRAFFETADKDLYWLNNIVAVGRARYASMRADGFTLRIDVWHLANSWNSTVFVDGSEYPNQKAVGAQTAKTSWFTGLKLF